MLLSSMLKPSVRKDCERALFGFHLIVAFKTQELLIAPSLQCRFRHQTRRRCLAEGVAGSAGRKLRGTRRG